MDYIVAILFFILCSAVGAAVGIGCDWLLKKIANGG